VAIDRETIERRDFPIARRGYSPAAVDAHLQAIAGELEELQRAAAASGGDSLAATAGIRVRSIIEAAEAAAADIRNQAQANAGSARTDADRDAEATRVEASARAQAHVAAVAEATAALLARIESIDRDLSGLFESLRGSATRLAGELTDVEAELGGLSRGAWGTAPAAEDRMSAPPADGTAPAAEDRMGTPPASGTAPAAEDRMSAPPADGTAPEASGVGSRASREPSGPESSTPAAGPAAAGAGPVENGDLDGARLTVLNMALNGEPREQADRYLAENFQLPDRERLIDEVYAAIER
jgi:DivIVA domain-containing protein